MAAIFNLPTKHQLFADHYLKYGNVTQAAIFAGYAEKSAPQSGSRLLNDDKVAAYIKLRLDENAMSANEVLSRLADHARASLDDFINDDGQVDLAQAKQRGKLHLLKSYTTGKQGTRIELQDQQNALVQLGKFHRIWVERLEIDWRQEARQAGLNPDELIESLAIVFAKSLERSGSGSVGESEEIT